jgi:hypothetical protein
VLLTDGALAADPVAVAEAGAPVELAIVPGGGPNAAVVSIAARPSPGAADVPSLYSRIANFGPEPLDTTAILLADGFEAGRQPVAIPADGGTVELGWALPPGTTTATVRLEANDALAADNEATLPVERGEGSLALRILLVTDSASPLERVLAAIPGADLTVEPGDQLERGEPLGRYDLVALESVAPSMEALARLDAPLLIVAPQPGGALPVTGIMPVPEIVRIRAGDPLLAGVDLAGIVFGESALLADLPGQAEIIGATDGPLVLRADLAGQQAIVLAFDLAGSNLPRRIAFPIMIANAVRELAPAPPPPVVPLGETLRFEPRAGATSVDIAAPGGDSVTLPIVPGAGNAADAIVYGDTGAPGAYRIAERDAAGNETGQTTFVVNAGHPRESDLRPNADLPAALAGAAAVEDAGTGIAGAVSQLWPLLALVAVALLLAEWLAALRPPRRAAATGGGD